jgi:hypothetical protein
LGLVALVLVVIEETAGAIRYLGRLPQLEEGPLDQTTQVLAMDYLAVPAEGRVVALIRPVLLVARGFLVKGMLVALV